MPPVRPHGVDHARCPDVPLPLHLEQKEAQTTWLRQASSPAPSPSSASASWALRDSAAAAATDADVVITMLPADLPVAEVVLGPDGVLVHARTGALLIDLSSVRP